MKWITRSNVKVDRVACPWLIKRFIDPQAEFLFVEERDLLPALLQLALIVRAAALYAYAQKPRP